MTEIGDHSKDIPPFSRKLLVQFCCKQPNRAFLYWQSYKQLVTSPVDLPIDNTMDQKVILATLEEFFINKHGWRKLNPDKQNAMKYPDRSTVDPKIAALIPSENVEIKLFSDQDRKLIEDFRADMQKKSLPEIPPCQVCKWIHTPAFQTFINPHTTEKFVLNDEQSRQVRLIHVAMASGESGIKNDDLIGDTGQVDASAAWTRIHRPKYQALIKRTVEGVKGLVAISEPYPNG